MHSIALTRRTVLRGSALGFAAAMGLGSFAFAADEVLKPRTAKPADAIVLFDGQNESQWVVLGTDEPADWPIEDGALVTARHDIATKQKFKDFKLHIEFNEPVLGPQYTGQDRGNSGIFLQGRYELQVLDSYHNQTYANGACGAIYGVKAPLTNAAKPPGEWQTYDVTFHAAQYAGGKKTRDAHVTVYWNGKLVQDDTDIPHSTGSGLPENAKGGPIRLQFHHHAVKFRNIWIVPENE